MRRQTFVLLVTMCLGHVLLISAQVQSKSGLPVIQSIAYGAYARVQQATAAIAGGVGSLWSNYIALSGAARENDALRRRVVELEGQLEQERAIASRTHALEQALAMQKSLAQPTLAARVIAGDPSPGSLTVTIDRGSADGVVADMAVVTAGGVVGRVINQPTPHAAQVQLLIGRTAAGAMIERTGTGGIVEGGAANPPLVMNFVSSLADVRVGDRVLTSGQDGIYPQGLVIGVVERVDRRSDLYRDVTVRPLVDFSHIDMVLVVLSKPPKVGGSGS